MSIYQKVCTQMQEKYAKVLVAQATGSQKKLPFIGSQDGETSHTILMRLYKTKPDSMKN